jgi:hypothetical protein
MAEYYPPAGVAFMAHRDNITRTSMDASLFLDNPPKGGVSDL